MFLMTGVNIARNMYSGLEINKSKQLHLFGYQLQLQFFTTSQNPEHINNGD